MPETAISALYSARGGAAMKVYRLYFEEMFSFATEATQIAQAQGNDRLRKLALERALVIIGEAAKKIPRDLQSVYPQILWKDIIDLRNVISHGYDEHTLAELEAMAAQEVQALAGVLRNILAHYEE
ncbi:MAG: HepT-like ribonuclease domain-containing protein [Alphaproteobacteria bacterium]|nr:HepT-like ribonuclease domain-containing protein [Alphaproteobacteria bacterium]